MEAARRLSGALLALLSVWCLQPGPSPVQQGGLGNSGYRDTSPEGCAGLLLQWAVILHSVILKHKTKDPYLFLKLLVIQVTNLHP